MTAEHVNDIVADVIADLEADPRWGDLTLMERIATKVKARLFVADMLKGVHDLIPSALGATPTASRTAAEDR